jgi:hypothetical protein
MTDIKDLGPENSLSLSLDVEINSLHRELCSLGKGFNAPVIDLDSPVPIGAQAHR